MLHTTDTVTTHLWACTCQPRSLYSYRSCLSSQHCRHRMKCCHSGPQSMRIADTTDTLICRRLRMSQLHNTCMCFRMHSLNLSIARLHSRYMPQAHRGPYIYQPRSLCSYRLCLSSQHCRHRMKCCHSGPQSMRIADTTDTLICRRLRMSQLHNTCMCFRMHSLNLSISRLHSWYTPQAHRGPYIYQPRSLCSYRSCPSSQHCRHRQC